MRKFLFPTTKLKLQWLSKRKLRLKAKVDNAYIQVRKELIAFLNNFTGQPDIFIKYLASCIATDDVITFMKCIQGVIDEAKTCVPDNLTKRAMSLSRYILFRIHWLSNFTLFWTNVKIRCDKCGQDIRTNFLYTDKICPYCGNIIVKEN